MRPQRKTNLFDECVHHIEEEYRKIGHELGWRFLCVSRKVLDSPVDIALITLNPGGDEIPADHPMESCEKGVSYVVEKWGKSEPGEHRLQKQVRDMFQVLCEETGIEEDHEELMVRSLISHFVPFRSPTFDKLPCQKESLETGRWLWKRILPQVRPRLVICLGRTVQDELRLLIPSALPVSLKMSRRYPTGWGDRCAEVDEYSGDLGDVRLLYLPHLSRYSLFSSDKCQPFMPKIIREACNCIVSDMLEV